MLHPDINIQWISDSKGYGLFAKKLIPKGTITYVQDTIDIVVNDLFFTQQNDEIKSIINKYSYETFSGERVISWDLAKYMNHCCYSNTLTTGYGFEVAITDIQPNVEVTDDYGIFTVKHEMQFNCENHLCLKCLSFKNFDSRVDYWDSKIKDALKVSMLVDQPLHKFLDPETKNNLNQYLVLKKNYISVSKQKPSTHPM